MQGPEPSATRVATLVEATPSNLPVVSGLQQDAWYDFYAKPPDEFAEPDFGLDCTPGVDCPGDSSDVAEVTNNIENTINNTNYDKNYDNQNKKIRCRSLS